MMTLIIQIILNKYPWVYPVNNIQRDKYSGDQALNNYL